MRDLYLTYLGRPEVEAAALADEEILSAIEASLAMQGRGETVIEPRVHLEPRSGAEGHFNVLRGFLGGQIGPVPVRHRARARAAGQGRFGRSRAAAAVRLTSPTVTGPGYRAAAMGAQT